MRKLAFLFSMLFSLNAVANTNTTPEFMEDIIDQNMTQYELEQVLFENFDDLTVEVAEIEVVELEETVELGFETSSYLPKRFNARKGMNDVDWSTIKLVEIEEEVELGFNPKQYLPKDFNPNKNMNITKKETIVVSLY